MNIFKKIYDKFFPSTTEPTVKVEPQIIYKEKEYPPHKCYCECNQFNKINVFKEEDCEVEFELECNQCKTIVGAWSYGCWLV